MDAHLYYLQFQHFQQNREKHFSKKLQKELKQQILDFLKGYVHGNKDVMNISSAGIYSVLLDLYKDARHYASLVYSKMPKRPKTKKRRAAMGFNEEFIRYVIDYLEADILSVSEDITHTTRDIILSVLQRATEEGRSLNWIEHELTDISGGALTENRSRLIARTETVNASNRASFFSAAKTGLKMKKEWLSARDNRVRPDHAAITGSIVDMEDYFNVGGSEMLLPGAKQQKNGLPTPAKEICNCRCVILYLPIRENGRLINHDYGISLPQ